ncbi:MAG TPA: hypothetical protein PKH79_09575 [Prolixibacteraceae bacterium]|nr:hypothetical protein [Prolixibacteraceae bacterium]
MTESMPAVAPVHPAMAESMPGMAPMHLAMAESMPGTTPMHPAVTESMPAMAPSRTGSFFVVFLKGRIGLLLMGGSNGSDGNEAMTGRLI